MVIGTYNITHKLLPRVKEAIERKNCKQEFFWLKRNLYLNRLIAVRCEPQSGVQVSVAHSPRTDFFPSRLVTERKWEHLGGQFRDVRLEKMEGRNFLHKMELLMASLTSNL